MVRMELLSQRGRAQRSKKKKKKQTVCGWAGSQKHKRMEHKTVRGPLESHDFLWVSRRKGEGREPKNQEGCLTCAFKDAC